ncbi:hypothetical protein [Aquicoccus porphyridii]|nr:hypothetical protein [Aquicoccus porphyridii]
MGNHLYYGGNLAVLRAMRSFLGENTMITCLAMTAMRLVKTHES